MNDLNRLHWPLIMGMGALALIWPIMELTYVMDRLGRPLGPIVLIVLISLAWLAIVVLGRVPAPLLTLVCTGIVYGVFAIMTGTVLSLILTGTLSGPVTHPFAVAALIFTHAIWGWMVGLIALAFRRAETAGR